jgi:hypothetical protein
MLSAVSSLQRRVRKAILWGYLAQLPAARRRALWPEARPLEHKHLCNCRIVENRNRMLDFMPKGGICAELGVLNADFSVEIARRMCPRELHLVDTNSKAIERAKARLSTPPAVFHTADSKDSLLSMPERYFDFIYIDADHSYERVRCDLLAAHTRVKPDGIIALNDYTFFAPSAFMKFGVVEALNEFCVDYCCEWLFFALQGRLYNDVAIRRICSS